MKTSISYSLKFLFLSQSSLNQTNNSDSFWDDLGFHVQMDQDKRTNKHASKIKQTDDSTNWDSFFEMTASNPSIYNCWNKHDIRPDRCDWTSKTLILNASFRNYIILFLFLKFIKNFCQIQFTYFCDSVWFHHHSHGGTSRLLGSVQAYSERQSLFVFQYTWTLKFVSKT